MAKYPEWKRAYRKALREHVVWLRIRCLRLGMKKGSMDYLFCRYQCMPSKMFYMF